MSDEKFFSEVKSLVEDYSPEVPQEVYSSMRKKLWWTRFMQFGLAHFNVWYIVAALGVAGGLSLFNNTNPEAPVPASTEESIQPTPEIQTKETITAPVEPVQVTEEGVETSAEEKRETPKTAPIQASPIEKATTQPKPTQEKTSNTTKDIEKATAKSKDTNKKTDTLNDKDSKEDLPHEEATETTKEDTTPKDENKASESEKVESKKKSRTLTLDVFSSDKEKKKSTDNGSDSLDHDK